MIFVYILIVRCILMYTSGLRFYTRKALFQWAWRPFLCFAIPLYER